MATISGILIDGAGQTLPNVQIVLTALKTSSKVLNQSKAIITTTSETGAYSINAQVGKYAVTVLRNGFPVERVGCIIVYSDSVDGTLNDFLLNPAESEITPEILAQVTEQRQLAEQAATDAQGWADEAKNTLDDTRADIATAQDAAEQAQATADKNTKSINNTVKKTGEESQFVAGILSAETLQENGQRVYSPNNKPTPDDLGAVNKSGDTMTGALTGTDLTMNNITAKISLTIGSAKATYSANGLNFDKPLLINNTPVLKQGDGGIYYQDLKNVGISDETTTRSGFIGKTSSSIVESLESLSSFACVGINLPYSTTSGDTYISRILVRATSAQVFLSQYRQRAWQTPVEFKTSANTTVSSNGTLMSASPILRLYAEEPEAVEGYMQAGYGLVNSEAQGVYAKKIGIGHYEIHGSLGFAKEGWYVEQPKDANGNVFSFVEYSTDENNVITVKTYKKKFDFETCNIVAGEPTDIKEDRWIDIRLEMPAIETIDDIQPIPSTLKPVII